MTVLAAVQKAAPWIGIQVPTALFTATDRTSVEMQALVNECAYAIAEDYDWQQLKRLNTITGDGSDTSFSLPSDYARMVKDANLWPSEEPNTPMVHILSVDDWLRDQVQAFNSVVKRYTIYGGEIHIKPAIASAATVKHFYISNKIVTANGGTTPTKTAFDTDTDTLFTGDSDRLLALAIVWRWKAAKGRPYGEDMENYNRARDTLATASKGARVLRIGRARRPTDTVLAWPGTITG